ncbi:MAG: copper oxidase [Cyanobacteria bacterium QS_3_48_167]|nr:MAG: copper oxidase [Cyanobacteria bacterium QS_1_48_34]PSO86913.1 MAG: copper oxidase [Cyanobacteria bacterium QS_3_48_167]
MAAFIETLRAIISNPVLLSIWAALVVLSLWYVTRDLTRKNTGLMPLMKVVWFLIVLYSGPIGLAVYRYSGRKQIPQDSLWRRTFRSDAHCYSGCGLGEIIGVTLTVGLLGLSNLWVALITFACAYIIGFSLTIGPLLQGGESLTSAISDSFWGETASITGMEVAAIGVDLWLAGDARMGNLLFWGSLIVSLIVGFFIAYPINALLIRFGVKEGMMNPRYT